MGISGTIQKFRCKAKSESADHHLSTSANPVDIKRAKEIEEVTGFETKPLSKEMMTEILNEHFQDHL